eukprot:jgi/Tetstr1/443141/TSEL_031197.t1
MGPPISGAWLCAKASPYAKGAIERLLLRNSSEAMAEPSRAARKLTVDFTSGDTRGGRVVGGEKDGHGIVLGREEIQEILAAAKANGAHLGSAPPQKELNIDLKAADVEAWAKGGIPSQAHLMQPQPNGSQSNSALQVTSGRLALGAPSVLQVLPLLALLLVAVAAIYKWASPGLAAKAGSSGPAKKKSVKKTAKAAKED